MPLPTDSLFLLLTCHWLQALLTNLSTMAFYPHCPFLCSQPIIRGLPCVEHRLTLERTLALHKPTSASLEAGGSSELSELARTG